MTTSTETQETAQAAAAATDQPEAPKKATARAQKPRVAASKGRAIKKTTPAKKRAPGAKAAKKASKTKPTGAREGSKTEKVVEMLKRSGGATLGEIMKATAWQPHSVRGFISGTLGKKMGLKVESAKNDAGERVYSIAQ